MNAAHGLIRLGLRGNKGHNEDRTLEERSGKLNLVLVMPSYSPIPIRMLENTKLSSSSKKTGTNQKSQGRFLEQESTFRIKTKSGHFPWDNIQWSFN